MNTRGIILFYLARKNCATLGEICGDLKISENVAKIALSRLAQERMITRRWLRTVDGKRLRLYCVNTSVLKELNL